MGRVIFLIPIVAVILLFAFGIFSLASRGTGTLVVEAQVSGGAVSKFVAVSATVSGMTHDTPFNITVSPGGYTVTYSPLKWYYTPTPRQVIVEGGKIAYSVGLYVPVPVEIVVSQSGPNSTALTVEHGVTPIIWVNNSDQTIEVESTAFSHAILAGGNYTSVVTKAGPLTVSIFPFDSQVTLNVN
jgi:hypothetical protein